MESVTFACFLIIQISARSLPQILERFKHFAIVQRVSKNHWLVWIFHPVVMESVHEYAVHFIVYSGYVLRHVH